MVATLTLGLADNSRVKKKLSGQKLTLEQAFLALLLDDFNILLWSKQKHRGPRPKSFYKTLTEEKEPKDELMVFTSAEDFNNWRKQKQED